MVTRYVVRSDSVDVVTGSNYVNYVHCAVKRLTHSYRRLPARCRHKHHDRTGFQTLFDGRVMWWPHFMIWPIAARLCRCQFEYSVASVVCSEWSQFDNRGHLHCSYITKFKLSDYFTLLSNIVNLILRNCRKTTRDHNAQSLCFACELKRTHPRR